MRRAASRVDDSRDVDYRNLASPGRLAVPFQIARMVERSRYLIRTLVLNRSKLRLGIWRRGWDSNPRLSFPNTRFPSVLLKPLGHLSLDLHCGSLVSMSQACRQHYG